MSTPSMQPDEVEGKCHVCQVRTVVGYCPLCAHFFCRICRDRWFHRGLAFVKELTGGPVEGCCGPQREEEGRDA